jgi:hypothetical protein
MNEARACSDLAVLTACDSNNDIRRTSLSILLLTIACTALLSVCMSTQQLTAVPRSQRDYCAWCGRARHAQ